MSLHIVIGSIQIVIAGTLFGLLLHWYFEAQHYMIFPLMKVFFNGTLVLIPICALGVLPLGFIAYPGHASRARGMKLLAWQIGLMVLVVIYAIHGYELNKDLNIYSFQDMIEKIRESKPHSKRRAVLSGVLEMGRNVLFSAGNMFLDYPYSAWAWILINRLLGLSNAAFFFAVLPVLITLICVIMVNVARIENNRAVQREEERGAHGRQRLI
jgi:hypothetical protein